MMIKFPTKKNNFYRMGKRIAQIPFMKKTMRSEKKQSLDLYIFWALSIHEYSKLD